MEKENKFAPIKITLVNEEAKEKDENGKVVVSKVRKRDPKTGEMVKTDESNYIRNDLVGLNHLMGRFDTRIHTPKDWKMSIKINSKITEAYLNDLKEIELTLDEASFLKLYLKELPEKEGKQESIPEFEIRTLFGIIEQME